MARELKKSFLGGLLALHVAFGAVAADPGPYTVTISARSFPDRVRETQEFIVDIHYTGSTYLLIESLSVADRKCIGDFPKQPFQRGERIRIRVTCKELPYGSVAKAVSIRTLEGGTGRRFVEERNLISESLRPGDRSLMNCTEVDLASEGGSMDGLRSSDQAFNTCSHHAATYLFDAYRLKGKFLSGLPARLQSSAIATAYELSRKEFESEFDSNRVGDVLKYLFQSGACPNEEIKPAIHPNASTSLTQSKSEIDRQVLYRIVSDTRFPSGDVREEFLRTVEFLADAQREAKKKSNGKNVGELDRKFERQLGVCLATFDYSPGGSISELRTLAESGLYLDFADRTVNFACSEDQRLRYYGAPAKTVQTRIGKRTGVGKGVEEEEALRELTLLLDSQGKKTPPVAVSYCSSATERKVRWNFETGAKNTGSCGNHVAVLVGRRKVGDSCQVRLRSANTEEWVDLRTLIGNTKSLTRLE